MGKRLDSSTHVSWLCEQEEMEGRATSLADELGGVRQTVGALEGELTLAREKTARVEGEKVSAHAILLMHGGWPLLKAERCTQLCEHRSTPSQLPSYRPSCHSHCPVLEMWMTEPASAARCRWS